MLNAGKLTIVKISYPSYERLCAINDIAATIVGKHQKLKKTVWGKEGQDEELSLLLDKLEKEVGK